MIRLFKRFFLLFSKKRSETELAKVQNEFKKLREDQKVLVVFCKDTLINKIKQIDNIQKNIALVDNQFVKVNELINQHADAINALIENYKKHIMNPIAHEQYDDDDENYKGKKQRNDN